ncbi:MAG: sugar transferase [Bacillota bacterium]|nr:sugar transferase [Bacillota bacterium]
MVVASPQAFRTLYFAVDVLALTLAALGAMYGHFGLDWSHISREWYLTAFLVTTAANLVLLYFLGLYESRYRFLTRQIPQIFQAVSFSMLVFFTLNFFARPVSYSRLTFLYYWVASFVFLVAGRFLASRIVQGFYRRGLGVANLLAIGSGNEIAATVEYLEQNPALGFRVKKKLSDLCTVDELDQMVRQADISTILLEFGEQERIAPLLNYCESNYLETYLIPDILDILSSPVDIGRINTIPLIRLKESVISGPAFRLKRAMDVIGAGLGLVILSPLLLLIALLVKLDSPGPVLFKHKRLGAGGKIIEIYKFRTMVVNAEEALQELFRKRPELREEYERDFKLKDDPRVTRLGKFLRKTSLDEFPQFINVLKGELSLVGPRPIVPREIEKYGPYGRLLLRVPPGVTGLWQVSGRSNTNYDERIKLDVFYINNWSLWLDIMTIIKTIPAVLAKKGAY